MGNLNDLGRRMYKLASDIELNTNDLVKKVGIRVHHEVVMATPVDTGEARSNWQMTVGAPALNAIGPHIPGSMGSTRGQNAAESIIKGLNNLDTKRPGQDVWISNNAPYIGELNRGTSRQAAAGFIHVAILVGVRVVKASKVTVSR